MTLDELGFANYEEYKKSRYWKRIKLMVGIGDNMCKRCGKRLARIPHHLTYKSLGEEKKSHVVGLCFPCNDLAHFYDDGEKVPLEDFALKDRWDEINSWWWYFKQKRPSDFFNWIAKIYGV